MVLLVAMTLLGMLLGLWIRPRIIAAPAAIALVALVKLGFSSSATAIDARSDLPGWTGVISNLNGGPAAGYWPVMAGALLGATITMVWGMLHDQPAEDGVTPREGGVRRRDRKGHYRRLEGMVEDRPIQDRAEERLRAAHEGHLPSA